MLEEICKKYDVDEKVMKRLVNRIIIFEKKNLNINHYTQSEVIQEIMNMIKEEVNKCY